MIWSTDVEEHDRHLQIVMKALQEANLYMNPAKCDFFKMSIDFLGHHISGVGIEGNSDKVDKILNWPVPKSITDIHVFLGLVRYTALYLPQLAEHSRILTALTKKEYKHAFPEWTDELNLVFESIKKLVLVVNV